MDPSLILLFTLWAQLTISTALFSLVVLTLGIHSIPLSPVLGRVDFLLIAELGFPAILLFSSDHMQWLLGLFFPAGILVVFMQFSLSCVNLFLIAFF